MKAMLAFLILLIQASDIPFKSADEYSVEINYTFKERPQNQTTNTPYDVSEKNRTTGPLPYLSLKVKILKAAQDEAKLKVVNNDNRILFSRKLSVNEMITIDMGFMDDIKDRIEGSSNEITIYTMTSKKTEFRKIHVQVMEDGTFMVNGEKRGKF